MTSKILSYVQYIYSLLLTLVNYKHYKNTINLKNSKNNKSLFIFGNGKSINLLDPKKIKKYTNKNFDVIAMNNYLASDFSKNVKPNYYLLADKRMVILNKKNLDKKKFLDLSKTHKILKNIKTQIFIPIRYRKINYFNNKIFYFNDGYIKNSKNIKNIIMPTSLFSLSGLKAISIGSYLGYKSIYICGLDNDQWKYSQVDKNNNIYSISSYFYESKNTHKQKETSISRYLNTFVEIFKSFEKFQELKIYNLDPNSMINIFNKKHKLNVYKKLNNENLPKK